MPKREIHREEEITMHDTREISEDELQEMKQRTEDAKQKAIQALKECNSFAVFTVGSGTGKHGVETIMAGEASLEETMDLLRTMHELIETVSEGVTAEVEADVHKSGRRHG